MNTIEFYKERIDLALKNFKKCGIENLITIKEGSALEILKELTENKDFKCDFLFKYSKK